MPIVTVQVTREGSVEGVDRVTPDQKAQIYKGISQLLLDVLHKPEDRTWIIFEEVELENWSQAGLPLPEYRRNQNSSSQSHSRTF